jgi:gas vesicle protein
MNRGLKWKLIVGFVIVFLAGGVTGVFVSASFAHHLFFRPYRGAIRERLRNHLREELQLSDDQLKKISPIIDKTATQLDEIRTETGQRVHETFAQANRQIAVELTPEQRARLQEIQARHRRWFRHAHERHRPQSPRPSPSPSAQ